MFEKILRMLSISFIVHRVECVAGRRSVQNKRANPSPESSFRTDLWRCLEMRRTSCRGQPKRTFPGNLSSLFALLPRVFLLSNSSREKFSHSRRKFEKSFLEVQSSPGRFFNFHTLYLILEFTSILIPKNFFNSWTSQSETFPFQNSKMKLNFQLSHAIIFAALGLSLSFIALTLFSFFPPSKKEWIHRSGKRNS